MVITFEWASILDPSMRGDKSKRLAFLNKADVQIGTCQLEMACYQRV